MIDDKIAPPDLTTHKKQTGHGMPYFFFDVHFVDDTLVSLNKALLSPYFWGYVRGGRLTSHDDTDFRCFFILYNRSFCTLPGGSFTKRWQFSSTDVWVARVSAMIIGDQLVPWLFVVYCSVPSLKLT